VVARTKAAGVEGHWGGRSLRAGLITSAAEIGVPLEVIARQSRHATLDSLIRYIRHEDPLLGNVVTSLGL
jgi:integrase